MHHCSCGCIREEDVRRLASKELRALEPQDLSSYHGSALYTWGDPEHYKHYLPRILELHAAHRNGLPADLGEVHTKLAYAEWTGWPEEEVQAITDFVRADWTAFVHAEGSELTLHLLEDYRAFLDLSELIARWDIGGSAAALRSFVYFFYDQGNELTGAALKGTHGHPDNSLVRLLQPHALLPRLEAAFFRYEATDPEYAEKLSIVLQMLEQEANALRPGNAG
ncbi:MAG: hypothetical protein EOO11_07810 [Chitinophagaceae bacterium]|nr:MAG: hypothetical protein EOO11_07810 [Chitinophagaceae bacterium]